jgi:hypothetical protein
MLPFLALGAIVLAGLLVYVGFPVAIRRGLKQAAEPQLIPFPLDHPSLPKDVAGAFQIVIDQLRPVGFEPITGLALPNATARVRSIVYFLVNRQANDVALATVIYSAASPTAPLRKQFSVEFVSHFRSGRRHNTNNGRQLDIFPPWPMRTINQFPEVTGAARLYRLHQALVARFALGAKVFRLDEEFQGDVAAALNAWGREVMAGHAVRTGYMYLSPEANVYRPTWKGAFLMTWKLMWPMKAIRRFVADRNARRLLAELEAERGWPA